MILVDENTTFIVQGITGREAVNLTRECLDYGSKVVGGVTPGRKGRDVHGVPVYDTVEQVVEANGEVPYGSVVTVPPAFTRDAVFEAMRISMQRGERIELRGFGVFQVKPRKRGIGRNPRTGKEVRIPPGRTIRFKPGKDLQNIGG